MPLLHRTLQIHDVVENLLEIEEQQVKQRSNPSALFQNNSQGVSVANAEEHNGSQPALCRSRFRGVF